MLNEVLEFFAGIRGRKCWSVIGGAGSGSVVSLRFGEKLRAKRPVKNPHLSLEERIFEGERSLIIYCEWRLERDGIIVSTSQSSNAAGSIDLQTFLTVKDSVVTGIGFVSDVHDLRVEFDNGVALVLFCNLPVDEDDSNYVMFNPLTSVAVTTSGGLLVERRS